MFRAAAAALALLLLIGAPAGAATFKVGFVTTLTGGEGALGRDMLEGFELGLRHFGGRFGVVEVELQALDDRRLPEEAARHAARLAAEGAVLVLGSVSEHILTAALGPVTAMPGALVLGLGEPPAAMAGTGCQPSFFSLAPPAGTYEEVMGRHLAARGFNRVWVVGSGSEEGRRRLDAFARGYAQPLAGETLSRRGQMGFGSEVAAIRQARPDAVFNALEGGIGVAFVRHWAAVAPEEDDIPLFGTVRTFGRPLLTAIGPAALGALHAAPWSDDMEYPANRRFAAEFEIEYGRGPSIWALRGYEAALMLEAAVKAAGGIGDRQKLRQALRALEIASPRGPLRFRPDQMVVETIYLRQVVLTPSGRVGHEMRTALEVRATPPGACPIIDPPPEKK